MLTADEARKSLIDKLKSLDEQYKEEKYSHSAKDTPETIDIKKLDTGDLMSDDEIKDRAENALINSYNSGKEKLETDRNKSLDKLETLKSDTKADYAARKDKTETDYEQKLKLTKNNAINKGVYRSSIYTEAVNDLSREKLDEINRIGSEYEAKIASYNAQMAIINSDYEKALKRFDIAHAVELENKINDLTKQRDKEELAMLKYNNNVEKELTEYRLDRARAIANEKATNAKTEREEAETEARIGMYGEKLDNYNKRYEEVYNVLKSLEYEDAEDVLHNTPEIKAYLGEKNYNKLNALLVSKLIWNKV